ncbi:MAG: hypothetical protein Q9173_000671 [Seirophora scorigena]
MLRGNSETVRIDDHELLLDRSSNSKRLLLGSGDPADFALNAPRAAEVSSRGEGRQTSKALHWVNKYFSVFVPDYGWTSRADSSTHPRSIREIPRKVLGSREEEIFDIAHSRSRGQEMIASGSGRTTTGDAMDRGMQEGSLVVPTRQTPQGSQGSIHEPVPTHSGPLHIQMTTVAQPSVPANETQPLGAASSPSAPSAHCAARVFKRQFRMAIHLPKQRFRICCLDTGADLDVISLDVVEDLGLKKDAWEGGKVYPVGESFTPKWQVTFDWHVAEFQKTYTSTFAVLDKVHSRDFDVLLGHETIENIGFYFTNGRVWMFTNDGTRPVQALER